MIRTLEETCTPDIPDQSHVPVPERLEALDLRVLALAEDFYDRTYGKRRHSEGRDARWEALRHIALAEGERALGITEHPSWDEIQRVYRLRQQCWNRIYSLDPLRKIGPLERAYADRRAGEAWFAMRHMEFVDISYYLDSSYLRDSPGGTASFNRIAETVSNLGDLINRLAGGNISNRPNNVRKKAVVITGRPIEIRERMSGYKKNRKEAVDEVTADMKRIFLECTDTANKERDNER